MPSVLFVELLCTLVPLLKQTVFVVVSSVFAMPKVTMRPLCVSVDMMFCISSHHQVFAL
jgi:hypothetical protein